MASGPVETDRGDVSKAEYDALVARCAASDETVARLSHDLAEARERITALESRNTQAVPPALTFFEGGQDGGDKIVGDGSDPRVLSFVLVATAVVTGMVAFLALLNGQLASPIGIGMVVLTVGLGWAASRAKASRVEVSVVRGLVYITKGDSTHRFDVRNASTQIQQIGKPGEPGWQLRFARKGMDPFVITANMVDAVDFMAQLRQWRDDL